jgi:hydrogenase maturation factor HypF (carbamoyltransferase family)
MRSLALMARDIDMVGNIRASGHDRAVLASAAALWSSRCTRWVGARSVDRARPAEFGFMLAYTPLHHLLMSVLRADRAHLRQSQRRAAGDANDEAPRRRYCRSLAVNDRDIVSRLDDPS